MMTYFRFTHVIHLAAQAGVRHSVEKPIGFIHDNIQCFATLMEIISEFKIQSLVYASSSSVYSDEDAVKGPFSDRLASLDVFLSFFFVKLCITHFRLQLSNSRHVYGASKRNNEMTARLFYKTAGIHSVGDYIIFCCCQKNCRKCLLDK